MRILITNDDGIEAEGIRVLTTWATALGEVTVVAPKFEQSAKSQSIVLRKPFEVRKIDVFSDLKVTAYSVDSTPADCVRLAVDKFGEFDLVFSGVNRGLNIGYDISYSGTCAAVFEANYAKIPAVAFSTVPNDFIHAEKALDTVWEYFEKNKLLSLCDIYNVNIPEEPRGIMITRQGGAYFRDHFTECEKDMFVTSTFIASKKGDNDDIHYDTEAVFSGYISIMPMTVDHTNTEALKKLI